MRDISLYAWPEVDLEKSEWYLFLEGRKVGPYSLDSLFGLSHEGEIRADERITSTFIDDQWFSLSEVRAMILNPERSGITPPSRPSNISDLVEPTAKGMGAREDDAADSLFNALQKSKEIQAKSRENERESLIPFNEPIHPSNPNNNKMRQLGYTLFFGFLFGISVWSVMQLLHKKEKEFSKAGAANSSATAGNGKQSTTAATSQNHSGPGSPMNTSKSMPKAAAFHAPVRPPNETTASPPQNQTPEELEREREERDRERDQIIRDAQQYQDPNGGQIAQPMAPNPQNMPPPQPFDPSNPAQPQIMNDPNQSPQIPPPPGEMQTQ